MRSGFKPQSLHPVARHNLIIHPLFWTSRQLDLVGCRFEDLEAENELQSHEHDCPNGGLWTIEADKLEAEVEQLAKSCAPLVKTHALINILGHEGSPFERPRLVLSVSIFTDTTDDVYGQKRGSFLFWGPTGTSATIRLVQSPSATWPAR